MQWCTSLFSIPYVLCLISPGRITKVTDIFVVNENSWGFFKAECGGYLSHSTQFKINTNNVIRQCWSEFVLYENAEKEEPFFIRVRNKV